MPRAYLRLDPAFDERKESYPDGPYAALIATFCLAELQPERGRFRSLEYLSRLLGKRGRHVRYLVEQGDLTVLPDGRVYVDGWDEWQEGDWKVAERVARIRDRRRPVTPGVTVDVTVPVTPDVTVGVTPPRLGDSGGGSGAIAVAVTDPVVAYMRLTGGGRPAEFVITKIRANSERYGFDEWLFAVNQARELYGHKNDIRNAEAIAEERFVARQEAAKRRREAEIAASRPSPEEAAANARKVSEMVATATRRKAS